MAIKKLKKIYYGLQGAKEKIDFEFSEFLPKETSISEFFSTYEKNFYSIPNSIHDNFIAKSIEYTYPEGWIHPLDEELKGLGDQVKEIQIGDVVHYADHAMPTPMTHNGIEHLLLQFGDVYAIIRDE